MYIGTVGLCAFIVVSHLHLLLYLHDIFDIVFENAFMSFVCSLLFMFVAQRLRLISQCKQTVMEYICIHVLSVGDCFHLRLSHMRTTVRNTMLRVLQKYMNNRLHDGKRSPLYSQTYFHPYCVCILHSTRCRCTESRRHVLDIFSHSKRSAERPARARDLVGETGRACMRSCS